MQCALYFQDTFLVDDPGFDSDRHRSLAHNIGDVCPCESVNDRCVVDLDGLLAAVELLGHLKAHWVVDECLTETVGVTD